MGQGVRLDVPRAAFGWATAYVLKDQRLSFDGPKPTLMGQNLRFDWPRPTF